MKDLSLHILDIIQNSIRAKASLIEIELSRNAEGELSLLIIDNGKGMDTEQLRQVKDPFFTTRSTRRIGLGVSLLEQKAEQTGGSLSILSSIGGGTEVKVILLTDHPDCPPLGDFPECAWMVMASNPEIRMIFRFMNNHGSWEWDSHQIVEAIEGLPFTEKVVRESLIHWFNADFSNFRKFLTDINLLTDKY
jgi:hypothetical protein